MSLEPQATAPQVSVEECARNFKVQAEKIAGLQDRAGKFAGMLAAFCERLGWRDLEALIAKFQVRSAFTQVNLASRSKGLVLRARIP